MMDNIKNKKVHLRFDKNKMIEKNSIKRVANALKIIKCLMSFLSSLQEYLYMTKCK